MATLSVGVVIPSYGAAAPIGSALQSPPPEQIAVADDRSVDETASVVQGFDGVRYLANARRPCGALGSPSRRRDFARGTVEE